MPQQIDVPGMGIVEFPDGMNDAQITAAIQKNMPKTDAAPSVGVGEDLLGVAKSAPGRVVAGVAGIPGDLYHLGLRALGDKLTPESAYGSHAIRQGLNSDYEAQREPGRLAQKAVDFAPAVIGGPEGLGLKLATRVAAPVVGSELGGAVAGPYGEVLGALGGSAVATAAARNFKALATARAGTKVMPSGDDLLRTGSDQFDTARDMNVVVKPDFATRTAADMRSALKDFDPEDAAVKDVFRKVDRLEALGSAKGVASDVEAIRAKYGDGPAAAFEKQNRVPVAEAKPVIDMPKAQSLTEFIASKGGLGPDAELDAIGAHGHTVNVEGLGRRKLVRQGGWPIDYAREAAEEAGYLRGQNGATSTPRDLLDALDAEMRGQKRYPQGFEGYKTKREATAISEREQHELDRHLRGFEDDLHAAGHGQLSQEVKQRAINLMAKDGMNADTAAEHAVFQLEQEDNAIARASAFPGDRPMARPVESPVATPSTVAMNDIENVRKQLSKLRMSPDASTREAAKIAQGVLTKNQQALAAADAISGDAPLYAKTMQNAVGNYGAGKRSGIVTGKEALGELNAATAGSGANEDNALRQAFKQLARPINNTNVPKWKRLGFNNAEGAAIERAATGSALGNTARYLGKLAPTGSVSGALGSGLGYSAAGPMGAVIAPAAGYIAKKIGDLSTKRAVAAVDSLVRSRSPLAAQVAAQLPPQIVQQLPSKTQALLQGLILADPALRQQTRQPVSQPAAY
jgi:hypothetical protein